MNNSEVKKIYRKCREHYGEIRQKNKATEEVGEFLQALNKYYEGQWCYDKVIEEIVDCLVCFEQILLAIADRNGLHYDEVLEIVLLEKISKIERLQKRIENDNG